MAISLECVIQADAMPDLQLPMWLLHVINGGQYQVILFTSATCSQCYVSSAQMRVKHTNAGRKFLFNPEQPWFVKLNTQ